MVGFGVGGTLLVTGVLNEPRVGGALFVGPWFF